MKLFDPDHISFNVEEFRRELAILSIVQHENLVPCYGACTTFMNGKLFIISELVAKGSLNDILMDTKQGIHVLQIICSLPSYKSNILPFCVGVGIFVEQ
jgi:serine/threonine protein kinase